jgi:hypothetical protein
LINPRLLAISGLSKQMVWAVKDGPLFLGSSEFVLLTDPDEEVIPPTPQLPTFVHLR